MSLDLKDVFDHHPDLEPENYLENHHQSYRDLDSSSPYAQLGIVFPLLLTIAAILYHLWFAVDHGLSIPELLWNYLVYMTPTRLIDCIETHRSPLRMADPALRHIPRTHAAKSEAMRSILGLDVSGGIMNSVAQAGRRRLSTIPRINVSSGALSDRPPGWEIGTTLVIRIIFQGGRETRYEDGGIIARTDLHLNDPKNNGKKIWTPVILKNMSSWQQQDAQEYYSKVLDEIDKEVAAVAYSAQQFQGFESEASPSSSTMGSHPMQFQNPLDGLIAQRVGCTKCGFSEGLSMIPFNCLTVPLRKGWEVDISECLDEYSILEEIEGVECGKCTLLNTKVLLAKLKERNQGSPQNVVYKNISERLDNINEALEEDDYAEETLSQRCMVGPKSWVTSTKTRQAVIARAPKSLVVHFNRSVFNEMTGELVKNPANVRFPKILDIGPWCLGSSGSTQERTVEQWQLDPSVPMIASTSRISRLRGPLYELRAVVTHFGRHENGHYICYRKQPVPLADSLGLSILL
ncbi:hypothetical protein B0O99DRAFT_737067 [Bisporella sp. PMI_857]|nr:hypothetical protein B0O99DRAFT_683055 [Bisporella sp. PMI_857]KAH8600245.1 hypothetical protein B0O99DRAFT_737067 [Bisporella sp. PMI_857]